MGKFKNQALADNITSVGISVTGPGFTLQSTDCPVTLTAGNECNFTIGFSPSIAGDATGELQVASSLIGSPERRSLFGTGLPPATPGLKINATAGDTYLSFAPQNVGSVSGASNVTINNTGTAPLIVSSVAITTGSADFATTATCTTTLAAGTTCTLPVTFTPSAANSLNGQLTIVSNAGNQIVTLSGTGVGTGVGGGLILNAVTSRKVHGAAGLQELIIDTNQLINQQVTVEPRMIGAGHLIAFQFNQMITNPGSVTVQNAALQSVGQSSVGYSGNEVRVTLTNILDRQRITIALTNVNGAGSATVSMGFLVGDVTNSRSVNASDIAATKARIGKPIDAATYKSDINADGSITASDLTAVKARAGTGLP